MGMIIRPDNTLDKVEPQNGSHYTLEELQQYVGGLIEVVQLTNSTLMIVNEEGQLLGLPFNFAASNLVQDRLPGQIIVGTVVVIKDNELK